VYGAVNQQNYLSRSYRQEAREADRLAHKVADDIVEAVTGRKGIASTRIVMVGNRSKAKELYLCDADGGRLTQLTRDRSVSVGPHWGPEGDKIVYTSYLKRFPDVFVIDLPTGKRERIAGYGGLNTGGAVSPDGRDVALVLSKDGNPELYIKNLRGNRLTRITRTPNAAEASPSWSPDGRSIAYVSDQSGRPQVYIVDRSGGSPRRLTSRGTENVAPDWGPGGLIAYSSRTGGRYHVKVIDPNTREEKQVTTDWADYEDPSWAPNGRHIVCGRAENYRSQVYILDTLGDPPIRLLDQTGDWYAPAWAPK
jgi:TolB protein